jgi:hypothetical protein
MKRISEVRRHCNHFSPLDYFKHGRDAEEKFTLKIKMSVQIDREPSRTTRKQKLERLIARTDTLHLSSGGAWVSGNALSFRVFRVFRGGNVFF